jgi:DNA-binding LacI/PurR family transcriptional regulator
MEFAQPHKRHMGYMEALREAGIEVRDSLFLACDLTTPAAYHAAKQMLGNPREAPTAIFCASDEMGFGAIMAAKDLGLRVPEDVSIVGIDNHDMSEFYGLTTVNQEVRAQGISAALKLLNLLENQVDGAPVNVEEETVWPTSLMIRSSTAKRSPDAR